MAKKTDGTPWGDAVDETKNYAAIEKVKQREINKARTKGVTPGNNKTKTKQTGKKVTDIMEWF